MRIINNNKIRISIVIITILVFLQTTLTSSVQSSTPISSQEVLYSSGTIQYQTLDILFEYGAETSTLAETWDIIGPHGSGSESGSYVRTDNTHVRSGENNIKFYQVPPSKSDAQRRVELRKLDGLIKEYYVSWWAYFPSNAHWDQPDTNGWGHVIGGVQSFIRNDPYTTQWMTSARFGINQNARRIYFAYSNNFNDGIDDATWTPGYYISDYMDRWIHFQVYIKWATDNSGIIRAWFNDVLIAEKTGIRTDPKGYSKWYNNDCSYIWDSPFIVLELYSDIGSSEIWYWVDDIVLSKEKVPSSYRVLN